MSVPVSYVAMPALAALLVYASARTIRPRDIVAVLWVGWPSIIACVTTFLCTLFLPIQAAVGIGVALSALLFVFNAAGDVSVVEIYEKGDGSLVERAPRKQLVGGEVVILDVYGNLFFAGARTLERMLPTVGNARRSVVILRMRGRTSFRATLTDVLARYASALAQVDGRLYLTGIGKGVLAEVHRTSKLDLNGPVTLYEASEVLGHSTRAAIADAQAWLVGMTSASAPDQGPA
jgi:SulP family sulfate permease